MNISFKQRLRFLAVALLTAFSTSLCRTETKEPAIIVTGFEPFHGDKSNPSQDAVRSLPDEMGGIKVVKLVLPVSYERGYAPLHNAIQKYDTLGVLSVGLLSGATGFTAEEYAYNLDKSIWPDNDGALRRWQLIIQNGPSTLKIINSFPIDKIVENLTEQGFVINKSNTSFRFLCNHVFYLLLNELNHKQIPAGFMHVPNITYYNISQDALVLKKALEIFLESILSHPNELSNTHPGWRPLI